MPKIFKTNTIKNGKVLKPRSFKTEMSHSDAKQLASCKILRNAEGGAELSAWGGMGVGWVTHGFTIHLCLLLV